MSTVTCEISQNVPPVCLSPWRENPYRLVSLWDIVNAFKASNLVSSIGRIENACFILIGSGMVDSRTRNQLIDNLANELRICQAISKDIGLQVTELKIARWIPAVEQTHGLSSDLIGTLADSVKREVLLTIEDELSLMSLFALTSQRKEYFEEPRLAWEEVIDRFPDATSDIEEMRKCFALSRYAACVFHSVQVIEHGLLELGKFLPALNDPKSGWTAVAKELQRLTKANYTTLSPFEQKHFAFIEQIQMLVEALKNAWRNKISHAQGRLVVLNPDFSDDIAEEIMMATRAFMRKLAVELP